MLKPYEKRLEAIHELLSDSSEDIAQEGYDSLFNLWLENIDALDFRHDLVMIAVEDMNIIEEFENRINDLVIKERITDIYLRLQLKKLATEVDNMKKNPDAPTKKIFISYSHKDERFKDDLVTILIPFQNQGILEIWQDRRIEEGDEWYQAIKDAMNTCDLALLLVSKYFLASSFIVREELPELLQRRKEKGLRVIPIIISECVWRSVPVLKDLQALPRDGKPLVSFRGPAQRDKIWTEIAKVIEKFAQK